jgi:hypothetical protein
MLCPFCHKSWQSCVCCPKCGSKDSYHVCPGPHKFEVAAMGARLRLERQYAEDLFFEEQEGESEK